MHKYRYKNPIFGREHVQESIIRMFMQTLCASSEFYNTFLARLLRNSSNCSAMTVLRNARK